MSDEVTLTRLKDQIDWYDKRSQSSQSWYKILKIVVVAIAALIPVLSGLQLSFASFASVPSWVLGTFGAAIAVIEGIQQINQYHANWISYRSTCEALKHEKYPLSRQRWPLRRNHGHSQVAGGAGGIPGFARTCQMGIIAQDRRHDSGTASRKGTTLISACSLVRAGRCDHGGIGVRQRQCEGVVAPHRHGGEGCEGRISMSVSMPATKTWIAGPIPGTSPVT